MRWPLAFLLLILAAALEAGGDALMRRGLLGREAMVLRGGLILLGAAVLALYGLAVNLAPWDFGRLLGLYVVVFFVMAQAVNWAVFGLSPSAPILVGGALILGGGLVMTFWRG